MRVLVIATGIVSLVWLSYLAFSGAETRAAAWPAFCWIMGSVAVGLLAWRCRPKEALSRTFWLSQDGASAATGPYTVAQIVAMWQQGQITTRGMVMGEGESTWLSIMTFADRFDASLPAAKPGFSLRRVAMVLCSLAGVLFVLAVIANSDGSRSRRQSQRLREQLDSPAVRSAMADLQRQAEQEAARHQAIPRRSAAAPALPPSVLNVPPPLGQ